MLGHLYDNQNCSAARALEVVGERWTLLILRDAMFRGTTRFSDFQQSLGIATNVLSKRLDSLVAANVLDVRHNSPHPDHRTYILTSKGLDFKPVIIALIDWGDRWAAPQGPPATLNHQSCEGKVELMLRCKGCDQTPKLASVVTRSSKKRRTSAA